MAKLSTIPNAADLLDFDGARTVGDVLRTVEYGDGLQITAFAATPAVIELGPDPVAVDLAWTIVGTVTGQTLVDSVAGPLALGDAVTDRALADVPVSSARTITITAENTGAPGGTDSKSRLVNIAQLPRRFWGVADATALDSAGVIALGSSELSGGRAKSFNANGGALPGKFAYMAYLASIGAPTVYRINTFDEVPVLTTVNVTTAAGLTADYIVLRSPNKLIGANVLEVG